MFVNGLIIPRMISTFPCKLTQFQKLFMISKSLNNKCSYSIFTNHFLKQRTNHITSAGGSISCLVTTNKTNILSKAMSGQGDEGLNVNYDDILKAQKDEKVLIIDVREDAEIQETGKLPGSIHIPMCEVISILTDLSSQGFEQKFNKKKPSQDTTIILSCRSGKRSFMVQSEIQKMGYKNALNYSGGWLDWESKQKA